VNANDVSHSIRFGGSSFQAVVGSCRIPKRASSTLISGTREQLTFVRSEPDLSILAGMCGVRNLDQILWSLQEK